LHADVATPKTAVATGHAAGVWFLTKCRLPLLLSSENNATVVATKIIASPSARVVAGVVATSREEKASATPQLARQPMAANQTSS
jgi:hypothetical protein